MDESSSIAFGRYHVQINKMISAILACAADEFQKSKKKDILKNANQSTLIKISSVQFF